MKDEYEDYSPIKGETTRMVELCRLLANRANLLDRLHCLDKTIVGLDVSRDELDAVLAHFRRMDGLD